ncbi:hypothetical protein ACFODL_10675 [Phenylobacterium terrae]|uniref:Glycosyltransferase RgtA/B/C/D-like domain-containing protein n=1 Tax=Phenylobacterium terrae TaxID=2665495 RepID=A0ABW4MXN3_9CAUL
MSLMVGGGEAMGERRPGSSAALAYRAALAAGFVAMLVLSFPGHLTYDSVTQLAEGRANAQQSWGPAIYAWVLGLSDRMGGGTGAYLLASAALLLVSLWSLPGLRRRTSWAAAAAAALVAATPAVVLYQGIVWKDVLFANLAVAGFVALAHAGEARGGAGRWIALALAALALALASLVRQNGLIVVVIAALTVGLMVRRRGWVRAALAAAGSSAAVLLLALAIDAAIQPPNADPGRRTDTGLRILLHYDILGAVARDPTIPLPHIDAANPAADDLIRAKAGLAYSPERVDQLEQHPDVRRSFWRTPAPAIRAQWLEVASQHPGAYLGHRLEAFRWVFLTPRLERCLPVAVGVEGVPAQLETLGLTAGQDANDRRLAAYALRFADTPIYSHAAYALLAMVLAGLFLVRGGAADLAMAGMLAAGLATAASYFAISIACDYRYLYILDLTALTGLLYFALDPSLRRVRRSS